MKEFIYLFDGEDYISEKQKELLKTKFYPNYQKIKKYLFLLIFKDNRKFLKNYLNIEKLIEHNNNIYFKNEYIKHQTLLDNIKGYPLDEEQRKCVLNDEEATLIIAGAGSGKSLTIIGKIRYLIETKYIDEDEILCISFTKESCNKLRSDLKNTYNYNIEVYTFHKLALTILKESDLEFNLIAEDTLSYLVNEFYDYIIYDYPKIKILCLKYFFGNKKKEYTDIPKSKLNTFKNTIISFINLYKANIDNSKVLLSYLKEVDSKNYLLLLNIIIIYTMYKIELTSQLEIDFDDLIVNATKQVKGNSINKKYKYIIIDEYQDTSIIRVNLIKAIIDKLKSKLIVVGDDFQSIYKFSGCNIKTFLNFKEYFPYSKTFFIQSNYRNNQEIIDVAGNFVMRNKKQLKKTLKAHKKLDKPIKIIYYENQKEIFRKLIKYLISKGQLQILILGRNNNDIFKVSTLEQLDEYGINLKYLTVHKSKGLEEDNIIIINLNNDIMGFPSKLKYHEIINLIYKEDDAIKYEEERRLFYVALTRTKNNAYLLVDKKSPSIFVKEIINDYSDKIEFLSIK